MVKAATEAKKQIYDTFQGSRTHVSGYILKLL